MYLFGENSHSGKKINYMEKYIGKFINQVLNMATENLYCLKIDIYQFIFPSIL